jgi:hypothetical protein
MVLGMVTKTRVAKEYRLLKGSSEMASFTISRKCGVRGDRARLSSRLQLYGGFFGNR